MTHLARATAALTFLGVLLGCAGALETGLRDGALDQLAKAEEAVRALPKDPRRMQTGRLVQAVKDASESDDSDWLAITTFAGAAQGACSDGVVDDAELEQLEGYASAVTDD